ncbi:ABC transporter substrate-binding protein [Aquipuribacter sp. MA13-6]|uniref:ABC transporter substrate-binding protein n=1 Tax=unclassified Aquipuribacter TaxID=2635084 RepID=UPI003EE9AA3E
MTRIPAPSGVDPLAPARLTRRRLLGAGGLVAGGMALAACGGSEEADEPAGSAAAATDGRPAPLEGDREVTIRTCVYAQNHASSMLFWERFAPEGVTIEVTPVTNTADIIAGLEGGTLDFGLMAPYVPMLTQAEGGITSKVVAMVARQGFGLVGRAGEVETVADLAGRRIAVPPPGAQVLVLNQLLEEAGLVLGQDVEGIPLGYADHVAALAGGDVDAFMGSEPPCSQAVVDGTGVRIPGVYDTALGDLNTALWASATILQDPEVVDLTVRMQQLAAEYMTPDGENDPEVWRSLLVDSFGFDEAVYEEVLGTVGAQWRFDEARESQFEAVGELLVQTGELDTEPDNEALYAREYWDL